MQNISDELLDAIALSEANFEQRKAFIGLTSEDVELLTSVHLPLQEFERELVDGFYEHLLSFSRVREILHSEQLQTSLRKTQSKYFRELTAGVYDLVYAKNRVLVGLAHERIGLTAEWYIGAYGAFLSLCNKFIAVLNAKSPRLSEPIISALNKVALLDITLALDAYSHASQQHLIATKNNLADQYSFQLSLGDAIDRVQKSFISAHSFDESLEQLLEELIKLTQSEFGLIGDVISDSERSPFLKIRVLTNIAWDAETTKLYQDNKQTGLEFHRPDNLLGEVIRSRKAVIANNPGNDPRAGGTPSGHPALHSYLGIPFFQRDNVIGMIGLANRPGGYDETLVEALQPLIDTLETLNEARLLKAQLALSEAENSRLAMVVRETVNAVLVTDPDFRIQWCNPAFENMSGYTLPTLLGENPLQFLCGAKTSAEVLTKIQTSITSKGAVEFELANYRSCGEEYWIHATCNPTFTASGSHNGFVIISLDITKTRQQQDALANFKSVVDQTLDAVLFFDADSLDILYANAGAQRQLQRTEAELKALRPYDFKPEYDEVAFKRLIAPLVKGSIEAVVVKTVHETPDGAQSPVEVSMQLVTTTFNQRIVINILRDISVQKRLDELRESNQKSVLTLLQRSADAMAIIDDGKFVDCNLAALQLFGFERQDQLLGKTPVDISQPMQPQGSSVALAQYYLTKTLTDGYQRFEWLHQTKRSIHTPIEVTLTPVIFHDKTCIQAVWRDLTDLKAQEHKIKQLAYFDDLTGLANRNLFSERVNHLLSLAKRVNYSIAVVFIQIANMNDINETLGYSAGDLVVKAVAKRLSATVRSAYAIARYVFDAAEDEGLDETHIDSEFDSLARLNCDNFALVAVVTGQDAVAAMVARLNQVMALPFEISGSDVVVTVRSGVSLYPEDAQNYDELTRGANIALNQAIELAVPTCYFNLSLGEQIQRNALMIKHLEVTLHRTPEHLSLRYQPQINLHTGELSGAEVLIRWHDPELGWISPAVFIPLAEERGLIDKVTSWVVESTCQQLNDWKSHGFHLAAEQGIKLAVNLSARSLYDATFLENLIEQIKFHGLSSDDFEFELTETGLMRDPEQAINLLKFLHLAGFKLAIDDFGIGQSSLSYLKNIDADILKIDMFFVRSMLTDKANYAIVKTIISTAKIFGMKTLAEGVEDEAIASELKALGCDYAQGYFYDAPLPPTHFYEKWLTRLA